MEYEKTRWFRLYLAIFGLIVAALFALYLLPERRLSVAFLDVGQGDSIYIRTPNGNEILIDGGPGRMVMQELGKVRNFFDRRIELIMLTHPNKDHLEGLLPVVERYEIGAAMLTGVSYDMKMYQRFLHLLNKKQIPIIYGNSHTDIDFGDGTMLDVIYPFDNLINRRVNEINNSSIMAILRGEKTIMLTGDGEKEVEDRLLKSGIHLQADILKVGHHGSRTSTTEPFLKAVMPKTAVISVGKRNSYGHPHKEVLKRLENHHLQIRRTDREKTISF